MVSYEEFLEILKGTAVERFGYTPEQVVFYPEGYTSDHVETLEWIRQQNYRYFHEERDMLMTDFIVLDSSGTSEVKKENSMPVKLFYESMQKEEAPPTIHIQANLNVSDIDITKILRRFNSDYEEVRSNLIIRPLNYTLHMRDLHNAVYLRISDFALVLYELINQTGEVLSTSKIQKSDLERWGMDDQKEQVLYDALVNTAKLYPACVYDKQKQKEVNFLETENIQRETISQNGRSILLSTSNSINGAVSLFYPGVVEKFLQLFGGPFFAVFMNINDVMLFSLDDPVAFRFAKSAGKSSMLGETLSNKCYRCDANGLKPAKRK